MDLNWPYIAGFFDGEGHVTFSQNRLQAGIAQAGECGRLLLFEIKEFMSKEGINSTVHAKKRVYLHRKPQYQLCMSRRQVAAFLPKVLPYLRIKKVIAQDVLRYRALFPNMITSPLCKNWRGRDRIRTHCKRGHLFTVGNTITWRGQRQCKMCVELRKSGLVQPRIYTKRKGATA